MIENAVTMGFLLAWGLLIRAAWIDWRTMLLPDVYTLGGAALALLMQWVCGKSESALWGACVGFALLKGTQLVYRSVRKQEDMGSGDPKLMLGLGAMTGTMGVLYTIAGASFLALLVNTKYLRHNRNIKIPFGPYLVCSSIVVYAICNKI